ncbi:MAG TPA: histidinol dehydrogenase, partial [Candidatus Melainabacteria bacterium]|nr:histidinol dehydrogenase [Candidatus Melainabacteria bacterium]
MTGIKNDLQTARARSVEQTVREIVEEVRTNGDQALTKLVTGFGDLLIPGFRLSPEQIEAEIAKVSTETKAAIGYAHDNIKAFAEAVMRSAKPIKLDHGEFTTGLEFRPVQRVGCYVPGGKYPLPSTALMTTITARVAGVEEIVVATPALCPESIYAASLSGVTEIYILGGAQAVAALALGTESIEKVDMVVGPGNLYVTEAKRQLLGEIGIDMLAGPSEIAVIADDTASARWLALDLVSQAEHGDDARAILLTPSQDLANAVKVEIEKLAAELNENLESLNNQVTITVLPSIEA